MKQTTSTGSLIPVLFYDFNTPPRDGLYWCRHSPWELGLGQRVKFGCENDGVMAYGNVARFKPGFAGVERTEWEKS